MKKLSAQLSTLRVVPLALLLLGLVRPAWAERATVMVLYFDNRSGDAALDPLAKGLADMMMTDLSALPELQVVERSRLEEVLKELKLQQSAYFDPQTAGKVGRGLGAQLAVAGAYAAQGRTLRIDLRLIRVDSGEVVKTGQVSGARDEFFELQRQLAQRLAEGLGPALSLSAAREREARRALREQRDNRAPTLESALGYGQALELQDRGDQAGAVRLLQQVAAQAPAFVLPRTRLLQSLRALALAQAAPPSPQEQQALSACKAVMTSQLLCAPGGAPSAPPPSGAPGASPPAPATPSSSGQQARGGVIESSLGVALTPDQMTANPAPGLRGGLFGGYKLGRFIVGLAFDLTHVGSGTGGEGTPGSAVTSFLLGPGLRVAALRLGDRAELLAVGDLLYGYGSNGAHRVVFDAGSGLRYWLMPRLALGTAAGLRGDFIVSGAQGSRALGIFVSLQLLGLI